MNLSIHSVMYNHTWFLDNGRTSRQALLRFSSFLPGLISPFINGLLSSSTKRRLSVNRFRKLLFLFYGFYRFYFSMTLTLAEKQLSVNCFILFLVSVKRFHRNFLFQKNRFGIFRMTPNLFLSCEKRISFPVRLDC